MSWTREMFIEYRKLKKSGYSDKMLKEHFGEVIYESGIYNKRSSVMGWLEFITEIKITPEYTEYKVLKEPSDIYLDKFDYLIYFEHKEVEYVISLFYYIINNIETYNILLTTSSQWDGYKSKLASIIDKGYITDEERAELVKIVEEETGFGHLYPVIRKLSYALLNFLETKKDVILSLGKTSKPVKINLYRNIIKNSFPSVNDLGSVYDEYGNEYFLYKI